MKRLSYLLAILISIVFIHAKAQLPVKKVLLEEFTTASCGNCPMMSAHINNWHLANAANSILVSIHEGSGNDAMSNATTDAIFNAMHPTGSWFAPAIMINRGVYPSTNGEAYLSCYQSWGSAPNPGIDSIATRLINEPAKVGVEISGTYNAGTRTISATVQATFADTVSSGDWRINLFLVEDSVIGYPNLGPFAGWDQHCYDANWANTNYPGMFDGTSIIGYPHRHVMRNALLGNWGVQGVIPSVPVVGTTYTATANYTVDTAYHDNHLSLVAFVSSYGSNKTQKFILNANEIKLTPVFTTGIDNSYIKPNAFCAIDNVFPSPAEGEIKITYSLQKSCNAEMSITDALGNKVFDLFNNYFDAGSHTFTFNTSQLSGGLYFLSLKTSYGQAIKKIIVR